VANRTFLIDGSIEYGLRTAIRCCCLCPRSPRYHFPKRRPWQRGDLAACSFGPGSTTFTRWVITQGSHPPIFVPWGRIDDLSLGGFKEEVEAEYGPEPSYGYRLHGTRVVVDYDYSRSAAAGVRCRRRPGTFLKPRFSIDVRRGRVSGFTSR
jgi:hypothetical protein